MSTDHIAFDEAVEQFLRALVVPRRLREPRVAERLSEIEPTVVAHSAGCGVTVGAMTPTNRLSHIGCRSPVVQSRDDERNDVADTQEIDFVTA